GDAARRRRGAEGVPRGADPGEALRDGLEPDRGADPLGPGPGPAASRSASRPSAADVPIGQRHTRRQGGVAIVKASEDWWALWIGLLVFAVMTGGAAALGLDAKRFAAGFSVILWASWLCWLAGNNAYVAATPDKRAGFGIGWSLSLTGEAGFIVALAAGLAIGNFLPG